MPHYHHCPSCIVVRVISRQFGSVPERQGVGSEDDEEDQPQTYSGQRTFADTKFLGFDQVTVVPKVKTRTDEYKKF